MMDLVGFCDVTVKTIWLTKRAIDDDAEALRVIRHEVAHCLQPPEQFYDEDAAHGKDFEAALAKVHNLTLPQCIGEGPRGEKLYAAA
jgi:predicted SprT family Zn-dependent metalloprotease